MVTATVSRKESGSSIFFVAASPGQVVGFMPIVYHIFNAENEGTQGFRRVIQGSFVTNTLSYSQRSLVRFGELTL